MSNLTGMPAIPFKLRDSAGQSHSLQGCRGRWLLMVFHRHLGGLPCRAHITQLRDREEEFRKRNVRIVVVTFGSDFLARSSVEDTSLSWPLPADDSRETYRAYGMGSASFLDISGAAPADRPPAGRILDGADRNNGCRRIAPDVPPL